MSPDLIFEVAGLSVNFGGVAAVSDVSFTLDRGEILGIIGPNGAGKTTVFDAISGFVNARGRVSLAGQDISGFSPEKRSRARLGRSFQDARLFPSLTVFETLAVAFERHVRAADPVSTALRLPWVARSERRIKNRVEELIELMGLGAFRDKFIAELSTGSRRIVDLAVIMAHDPLVLLLDEPSSGIAQRETEALGPLLLRIREETGASLLVIEHDMPLIRSISDEILALETGQVVTRGTAEEVLNDPRVVAAYLGTNQAVVQRSGRRADSGTRPAARKSAGSRRPAGPKAPADTATAAKGKASSPARKRTAAKKVAATKTPAKRTSRSAAAKEVVIDLTGDEPVVTTRRSSAGKTAAATKASSRRSSTTKSSSGQSGSAKASTGSKTSSSSRSGSTKTSRSGASTTNGRGTKTTDNGAATRSSNRKATATSSR